MKYAVLKAINKTLAVTLIGAIIATGAYAVHLTNVSASITITFGKQVSEKHLALADAIDVSQLMPLPMRKPLLGR